MNHAKIEYKMSLTQDQDYVHEYIWQ